LFYVCPGVIINIGGKLNKSPNPLYKGGKMKKLINYLKSFGWEKKDIKNILMLIIMLLVTCVILNKFLKIQIETTDIGNKFEQIDLATEITKGINNASLCIENAATSMPAGFKITNK